MADGVTRRRGITWSALCKHALKMPGVEQRLGAMLAFRDVDAA